jgi:hypothetical protein
MMVTNSLGGTEVLFNGIPAPLPYSAEMGICLTFQKPLRRGFTQSSG